MTHQLRFASLIEYDVNLPSIEVSAVLGFNETTVEVKAKLDTGSSHCVFERWQGELLGLDIEAGWPRTFSTATGSFQTYGHWVTLSVKQFDFDVMVYFAKDHEFNRNVLGRHGFLQLVRLGLIDYDGQLFLSHRDDLHNGY